MAEYHVGCGLAAIYAGTLNKKGDRWVNKSDVTDEAVRAVAEHMYHELRDDNKCIWYMFTLKDGKKLRLMLEVDEVTP